MKNHPLSVGASFGALLSHAFGSTVSDQLAAQHLRPAARSTVSSDKRGDRKSASYTKRGPGRKHKANRPYTRTELGGGITGFYPMCDMPRLSLRP